MLNQKDKVDLAKALEAWGLTVQKMLNERFGQDKIGHIIIAFSTDSQPTVTYSTNCRQNDFSRLLKMLSEKESKVLKTSNNN